MGISYGIDYAEIIVNPSKVWEDFVDSFRVFTVRKIYRTMKACTLYVVFVFFVTLFVTAIFERGKQFRYRSGEPLSDGQRTVAIFIFFLLVIISGYGAFKRGQLDWKHRKKKRRKHSSENK